MEFINYNKYSFKNPTTINRDYKVLKISYDDFDEQEKHQIFADIKELYDKTNPTAANTGKKRDNHLKLYDSISGVLAEFATKKYLNTYLEEGLAIRPKVDTSHNQVDIELEYRSDIYSIEVRSSFVRNGIPFALYGVNTKLNNRAFFDVLGPYKQDTYKKDFEDTKNIYFRVLFDGNKTNVGDRFLKNYESFYIIGAMFSDELVEKGYIKELTPKDAVDINSGQYYVAPINEIQDVAQILESLQNKSR